MGVIITVLILGLVIGLNEFNLVKHLDYKEHRTISRYVFVK